MIYWYYFVEVLLLVESVCYFSVVFFDKPISQKYLLRLCKLLCWSIYLNPNVEGLITEKCSTIFSVFLNSSLKLLHSMLLCFQYGSFAISIQLLLSEPIYVNCSHLVGYDKKIRQVRPATRWRNYLDKC